MLAEYFDNIISVSPIVLEEDFYLKKDAYFIFPCEVNDFIIRKAIWRFSIDIENIVKYMDHVYCCYSWFVDNLELDNIFDNDVVSMTVFDTNILYCYDFNICDCCFRSFNFYHDC